MDLLRKYLLSSVARAADGDGAVIEPPAVPDPAAVAEPAAGDPPAEPEPAAGDPPAAPEPAQHGNKGKSPWFLERISEESAARRAAEQRASDAEAMLQRLQNAGGQGDPPAAPKAPAPAQDFESAVTAEASRREVARQCNTVASAGFSEYPDWAEKTNILGAVNAATPDFVMDVVAVDAANAHKLLYQLANDPERAARLAAMEPRRRTSELTRMAMTAAAPAADAKPADPKPAVPPKTASRAPAPAPQVTPSASKVVDWRSDEASEDDFTKGFNEMMEKRSARR